MFVLGITGGIGTGKSTVARILKAHGAIVLDADEISRDVTKAGGSALSEIIDVFGPEFIAEDGSMNRKMMADKVFKDSKTLDALSMIVHEKVFAEMSAERQILKQAGEKLLVMDVPVPAKEGFIDVCDQIWVVWADENIRLDRLAGRGMSEAESRRRMKLQLSKEEYFNLGDIIIENNESIKSLEEQVNELIVAELHSRGIDLELGFAYSDSL